MDKVVNQNCIADILLSKGIKLSHQRMKVLEYLKKHPTHPTAEEIYLNLHPEMPTLSKATVYNTLNLLQGHRLVTVIKSEDKEARYDINVFNHGHFKCQSCNNIFDFEININSQDYCGLDGYEIKEKNILFKGICKDCLENKEY